MADGRHARKWPAAGETRFGPRPVSSTMDGDRIRRLTGVTVILTLLRLYALCCAFVFSLLCAPVNATAQGGETWLLVDTGHKTLAVMEGASVVRSYTNISIGRGGTTTDKRRDDDKTPLGEFHIARVLPDSHFHRFFGFDYPSLEQARRALLAGEIDARQYDRIRLALRQAKMPPQQTPLGGFIGIHGVGAGDPRVHEEFNWTSGCIALTNEQIDDLAAWIRLGMRVVVR
jgi:L,D-transpeptidase catalytic domain